MAPLLASLFAYVAWREPSSDGRVALVLFPGSNIRPGRAALDPELYSQRQWMVEPVFADIKQNRRAGRFKRRGRVAVRSEWRLIAATHNLLKLHRHAMAAATA